MLMALAVTLALELLFALLWGVRGRGLMIVLLMNIMTNPAVNLLYDLGVSQLALPRFICIIVPELCAFAAEALCCRGIIKKPWLFAFLINLFSYGCGLIIQNLEVFL